MVDFSIDKEIAQLVLDRPPVNALDCELCEALTGALDQARRAGVRAVVLTGRGPTFSAGVDLKRVLSEEASYTERMLSRLSATIEALLLFPLPVVAAINGSAIAGGWILAAACDTRIAAAGEHLIGIPEMQLGLPIPPIGFEALRLATPPAVFAELVRGTNWPVAEAHRAGLVDELVAREDLAARALAAAGALAAAPQVSYELTKLQERWPAVEQARRAQRRWGARMLAVWTDPESRRRIAARLEELKQRRRPQSAP
jgi:enoyl-CoA hydratase